MSSHRGSRLSQTSQCDRSRYVRLAPAEASAVFRNGNDRPNEDDCRRRIDDICHGALECDPQARGAFVAARHSPLLAHAETAEQYLSTSLDALAAEAGAIGGLTNRLNFAGRNGCRGELQGSGVNISEAGGSGGLSCQRIGQHRGRAFSAPRPGWPIRRSG